MDRKLDRLLRRQEIAKTELEEVNNEQLTFDLRDDENEPHIGYIRVDGNGVTVQLEDQDPQTFSLRRGKQLGRFLFKLLKRDRDGLD